MLIQRVITALVLLPLLLAAVWYAPTPWLYAIFSGAAVTAAWEWAGVIGWAGVRRVAYAATTAVLLGLTWSLHAQHWQIVMMLAAVWWVIAIRVLLRFPENSQNLQNLRQAAWPLALLGEVMFLPTILATAVLRDMPDGAFRLIYVFGIVFAADTGAYLAGRNFGKRKLAPSVSPGKMVEGALGGLLLCAAWALTAGVFAFHPDDGADLVKLLLLSLLVALISIVGDLTESMFKRIAGMKDSGHILPGHGGMLDRVDSLLAALPVMALGLYFTGL
jgi:phosphatidate cytidylyltransferase